MAHTQQLEQHGYTTVNNLIDQPTINSLAADIQQSLTSAPTSHGHRNSYALRHLLQHSTTVRQLAQQLPKHPLLDNLIHRNAQPVRGIYFDKTPDANWAVGYHQDLTIAVQHHHEIAGFGPWSNRNNIPNVQPPTDILEQLLIIRIHLDPASQSNGQVRLIPDTHTLGKLDSGQIQHHINNSPSHCPQLSAGGALLMRPLLLHASSPAPRPTRRRTIHLVYAHQPLPKPLEYAVV